MLSIVATPIGNLGDITIRALETLRSCDAIVCEDTRVTGKLLTLLGLPKKELISFHSYSDPRKVDALLERLRKGQHLVLVCDSGTPGISDPGYVLVKKTQEEKCKMEVIPGPSAFLAALSASGLPINRFTYLGYLPMKKGRKAVLESIHANDVTTVFYESVHRIEKTLLEIAATLHDAPHRPIVIARELTKMHEEVIRTTVTELPDVASRIKKKGEFVVVIGPTCSGDSASGELAEP